jgi:uncharacterized NAD(P)/FAD-binding protein YdhS
MGSSTGRAIAIVGAGFTGTLLALHLLRRSTDRDRIYLIEKNRRAGPGLAYSTGNSNHVLNVRAGNMSAFAAEPQHFVEWLRRLPPETRRMIPDDPPHTASFAPRGLFGVYIQQLLAEETWRGPHGDRLIIVNDEAVDLARAASGLVVRLAAGRSIAVDTAILAIGNLPATGKSRFIFSDPWDPRATRDFDKARPVLILGTGLTMVDTAISLLDGRHRGPIYAVSRRGLLPRIHLSANPGSNGLPAPWVFDPPPYVQDLAKLAHRIRADCRNAEQAGIGWRGVIDGLRPHTQRLWRELSLEGRARFLRHLRPWWDVHRHRGAPEVMARIEDAQARGQLQVMAGKVSELRETEDGVAAKVTLRGGKDALIIEAGRSIDCTGLGRGFDGTDHRLLRRLAAKGMIRSDPLGLGLNVTADGALIATDGIAADDIFAIGPLTKGAFWEIVAVPDLRVACESMAEGLLRHAPANLTGRPPYFASAILGGATDSPRT